MHPLATLYKLRATEQYSSEGTTKSTKVILHYTHRRPNDEDKEEYKNDLLRVERCTNLATPACFWG